MIEWRRKSEALQRRTIMKISDALLPEFDQEAATTRKVLARVADDKLGFKPHEKSWDMAALASHIANLPSWAVDTLTKDSLDYAPPGGEPYKMPKAASSQEELLDLFDKNSSAARQAIAATSDEDFMKPWTLLGGGKPIFTMPRIAVLRGTVMNHAVHHRGQLSVYLRLNNIPVPAMYGPSADES
jgi:uncharacterized damage-inducible protein DinB